MGYSDETTIGFERPRGIELERISKKMRVQLHHCGKNIKIGDVGREEGTQNQRYIFIIIHNYSPSAEAEMFRGRSIDRGLRSRGQENEVNEVETEAEQASLHLRCGPWSRCPFSQRTAHPCSEHLNSAHFLLSFFFLSGV